MDLIERAQDRGIQACVVCHDLGTEQDRARLLELTKGEALFTPLYWWNRKIRTAAWKRPLSQLKQLIRTGGGFGSTRKVSSAIRRWKPDLIHTNTILTPEGGWAARQCGLPHVWHVRELIGLGQAFRFYREGPSFGKYVARYCDKIHRQRTWNRRANCRLDAPGLIDVVPNGIDMRSFSRPATARQVRRFVVGMVATLTSRSKKQDLFIAAGARVDRRFPIEWRIYGQDPSQGGQKRDDPYINRLHDLIRAANVAERFRFPGHVGSPAQIMSEIDLLVQKRDGESFGRVVVEAMASGVPTVGVRGGGSLEIVVDGETGLLAAPDNPEELAQCIERVVNDPKLASRLGAAGRHRAETHFSLDACVDGVLGVYSKLLEKPATAR